MAASPAPEIANTLGSAPSGSLFVANWLWFFVLSALVVGVAYLVAILQQRKKRSAGEERKIRILNVHRLGPKEAIVVSEIDGRTFVLGHTQHSINLLTELKSSSTVSSADEP
ncbi:MAG: FliO/MopB family protein [Gammaproteobacteria bacterium]|nr:FliO/MopB family protein [Gammaproteobacteria bacterium]